MGQRRRQFVSIEPAMRFTGKYQMDVGQHRRWWWNEYINVEAICVSICLLGSFLNDILDI